MQKIHTVKATKCTLAFTENELMGCLALQPDIFERAVGRGKRILREQSVAKRQGLIALANCQQGGLPVAN